jgi:hypothetical protein
LEGLGWTILRIWSTDWWSNPERETTRLNAALDELRSQSLIRQATMAKAVEAAVTPIEPDVAAAPVTGSRGQADPPRFYDDDYQPQLTAMIVALLGEQGPLREDVLASAIAREHGFHRTGGEIRMRVMSALPNGCIVTPDPVGRFVWPENADPDQWLRGKPLASGQVRDATEVTMQELVHLARPHVEAAFDDEAILIILRNACGMARMGDRSRSRCQEAIALARTSLGLQDIDKERT